MNINESINLMLGNISAADERPVTERIKTFADACQAIGIKEEDFNKAYAKLPAHAVAYLKLTVIAQALNEGWEPQFTDDEYRWYPWFVFYTQEEIDKMSKENKSRVVGRAYDNSDAYGGVAYANANGASSYSSSHHGSRLAFKTEELAIYAGRQFVEIYADFVWKEK